MSIKLTTIPAILALISFNCSQPQEKTENIVVPDTAFKSVIQQAQKPADKSLLIGDWTRTDAPYQIKITELLDEGKLIAGYYNPKSIHVGKAFWANTAGDLKIYIELQDINYPGSNYKLSYMPDRDVLAGVYFQAVESQTYQVEFARTK